jgi:uncharacterized membrane protein YbhN (UPF0104 family)
LSFGFTLLFLCWLATLVDVKAVWQEVLRCDKFYVALGGLCHYLTYPVRGARWRRSMAQLPARGSRSKFGLIFFFFTFVDNLVPAKLGDVYAAHLARINFGIRRSAALGSLVFLRTVDAWMVLLLGAASSWAIFSVRVPESVKWPLIGGVVIAGAATIIALGSCLLGRSLPAWIPVKIQHMIRAFQTGVRPQRRDFLPIGLHTAVTWALEVLWIFFLLRGLGLHTSPTEAVFLTMVPVLATAFPFTPSGAGVVELTLFSCLRVTGVSAPLAASVTVLNRFIDYWLHIVLGLLIWVVRRPLGLRSWREVPLGLGHREQGGESLGQAGV